jgi:hypothetical protein
MSSIKPHRTQYVQPVPEVSLSRTQSREKGGIRARAFLQYTLAVTNSRNESVDSRWSLPTFSLSLLIWELLVAGPVVGTFVLSRQGGVDYIQLLAVLLVLGLACIILLTMITSSRPTMFVAIAVGAIVGAAVPILGGLFASRGFEGRAIIWSGFALAGPSAIAGAIVAWLQLRSVRGGK